MKSKQLHTNHYQKSYVFEFKGEKYVAYSTVKLTDEAMYYLETTKKEVQLIEEFIYYDGTTCWKYALDWTYDAALGLRPLTMSTDRTPDELIEEVVKPATIEYLEFMVTGKPMPSQKVKKISLKDWEIPGLMTGWVVFILVCIGIFIFKDWIVKFLLWNIAGWYFGFWRQKLVNAHTIYKYEENTTEANHE